MLNFSRYLLLLLLYSSFSACNKPPAPEATARVQVKKSDDKYVLYRNGKPYAIKGASGYTHLAELAAAGGNTIRVWDTTGIATVLKSANDHGIAVIVGLPLPESYNLPIYNDKNKVANQFKQLKSFVNRHKNNPAVLMWCVGNELVFPLRTEYNNFYSAFNDIVDMIHKDDPDHPVTTTMVNFQRKEIFNIKMRTDVDVISFNTFSRISTLKDDIDDFSWFWNGPFLVTEWAIDGPWQDSPQNAWNANVEPSSTKKAEHYLERYKKHMPVDNPGFLGSFIFFWGQKQETTHTWFSIFDDKGNKTEVVEAATEIWKGKKSRALYPQIDYMLLNGKGAKENLIVEPGKPLEAVLQLLKNAPANVVTVEWAIYPEDWFKKNNINNVVRPPVVKQWKLEGNLNTTFIAPGKPGAYRLFATISNGTGSIANANIPFYVIQKP